ncbi:hypothetical protein ACH5RR_033796 [Cinchona calisaya]|uniref:Uncharacterized protein n=1 Tax=Cinchona calisaya TaxID=153742 RepID=A0ABD2YCL6_9GENT
MTGEREIIDFNLEISLVTDIASSSPMSQIMVESLSPITIEIVEESEILECGMIVASEPGISVLTITASLSPLSLDVRNAHKLSLLTQAHKCTRSAPVTKGEYDILESHSRISKVPSIVACTSKMPMTPTTNSNEALSIVTTKGQIVKSYPRISVLTDTEFLSSDSHSRISSAYDTSSRLGEDSEHYSEGGISESPTTLAPDSKEVPSIVVGMREIIDFENSPHPEDLLTIFCLFRRAQIALASLSPESQIMVESLSPITTEIVEDCFIIG